MAGSDRGRMLVHSHELCYSQYSLTSRFDVRLKRAISQGVAPLVFMSKVEVP